MPSNELIDLENLSVRTVLPVLLKDKTTDRNIIWATDSYTEYGSEYEDKKEITKGILNNHPEIIKPRILKSLEDQQNRTRKKAEVFTPAWVCNQMNNYLDDEWFGRKDVFNIQTEKSWEAVIDPIAFQNEKAWKKYVDSRRMEITCGEAPYLVSRYDTSTGELIVPLFRRIGLLDRKMRIVTENAASPEEWLKWAERALQSCYGYEYQGDNLLIARINVLLTYIDYYRDRFGEDPTVKQLKHIAHIISWNLWQMDGLKGTVPLGKPYEENHQMTLFEWTGEEETKEESVALLCRIYDWRANHSLLYKDLGRK